MSNIDHEPFDVLGNSVMFITFYIVRSVSSEFQVLITRFGRSMKMNSISVRMENFV